MRGASLAASTVHLSTSHACRRQRRVVVAATAHGCAYHVGHRACARRGAHQGTRTTCNHVQVIVRTTVLMDVDDQDRKRILVEDFEESLEKGYIHTVRPS